LNGDDPLTIVDGIFGHELFRHDNSKPSFYPGGIARIWKFHLITVPSTAPRRVLWIWNPLGGWPNTILWTLLPHLLAGELLLNDPVLVHQTQHAKVDRGFIGLHFLGQDFDVVGLAGQEQMMQELFLEGSFFSTFPFWVCCWYY
jgi:hypothetical protein